MRWVLDDVPCSLPSPGAVQVPDSGQGALMMHSAVLTVLCSLVLSCLVAAPNQSVRELYWTDSVTVELQQQLLRKTMFPQEP